MDWIGQHWLVWASLLLIAAGVGWAMPQAAARPKAVGIILALLGTVLLASQIDDFTNLSLADEPSVERLTETVLFWLFAITAIAGAVLMITHRNPVYSAIWFAVVTFSVCGLFLLQYAAFLAAATVIIYAGAIVVTFVFVIMLAQQYGATIYDQRSRQPLIATTAAFILLATVVGSLLYASQSAPTAAPPHGAAEAQLAEEPEGQFVAALAPNDAEEVANPLSQVPTDKSIGQVRALGRSLFGDYLYAVELAGTLLLIAMIGAICIAPRRRGGQL